MRYFRRLPPLLRVASILGRLFPLAFIVAFMVLLIASGSSSPQWGVYAVRVAVIALNLGIVGVSCTLAVHTYNARFRQPGRGPFLLDSWQSQVRAILLPAALSICALVLAVVISPTASAFEVVFPVSIIGGGVFFVFALDERRARSRGLRQTPRAW